MTDRPRRISAIAALRRAALQSRFARNAAARCAAATDCAVALLIVFAGLMAWSPRSGAAAMRETVATRRERRLRIREIGRTQGEVWARHARRNPPIHPGKFSASPNRLPLDP
jgi:hypothetical protein